MITMIFSILSQPTLGQQSTPTVSLAFIEPSQCADVGPNDTGEVKFNGVVSVSINMATRVIVNLSAEDTWNSAIVTPDSIVFTSSTDKSFIVTVSAPLGTSFNELGMVIVTGTWTSYPGEYTGSANPVNGAISRIDINQFFKFSLESDVISKEVTPGSELQFELIINNEGNYIETFTLEIINQEELSTKGIDVGLTQANIEILENGNETIIISLQTNNNMKPGENKILIKVTSDKGIKTALPQQDFSFKFNTTDNSKDNPDRSETNLYKIFTRPFNILIIVALVIVIGTLLIIYWTKKELKNKVN